MRTTRTGPASFTGFVLLDLAVPLASFYALRALGASVWTALVVGAAVPIVRLGAGLLLHRRLSRASLLTLALVTTGTAVGLTTADPRLLMARESYLTGVVGIWILLSLLARRPLVFTATAGFMKQPASDEWHASWDTSETFRRAMRGMTWGFGLAFVADAVARVVMSYTLPLDVVPVASSGLLVAMLVCVVQAARAWGRRQPEAVTR